MWACGRFAKACLPAILGLLLAACGQETQAPPPLVEQGPLQPVSFEELPGWHEDRLNEAAPALRRSCERLLQLDQSVSLGPGGMAGQAGEWHRLCETLLAIAVVDDATIRQFLVTQFTPFRVADKLGGESLFTGYYEAELRGAKWPGGRYQVPLYRQPDDLVKVAGTGTVGRMEEGELVPYFTRAEIEDGALHGQNQELLWVDDPVDAFLLHVQGSGQVRLPDGGSVRVGFAGHNGHEFYAIGRALIASGALTSEDVSMQAIRDWLRANPGQAGELMNRNARYIFFQFIEGDGPVGAANVALTPERSLAIDHAYIPYHAPVWLDTTWPSSDRPLQRLMLAQDTGSAIKGPVRGDFFWGFGEPALAMAGRMKQKGALYLMLPKAVAARLVPTG